MQICSLWMVSGSWGSWGITDRRFGAYLAQCVCVNILRMIIWLFESKSKYMVKWVVSAVILTATHTTRPNTSTIPIGPAPTKLIPNITNRVLASTLLRYIHNLGKIQPAHWNLRIPKLPPSPTMKTTYVFTKEHDQSQPHCDYKTEASIPTIPLPLGSIRITPDTHRIAEP
jgi:hypothetical protein